MKRKGFTLVELLAVIGVLGIILVIAVPKMLDTIKLSRLEGLRDSTQLVAKDIETSYQDAKLNRKSFDKSGSCVDFLSNLDNYESCTYTINSDEKATTTLVGKGKFEGYVCIGDNIKAECWKMSDSVVVTLDPNGGTIESSTFEVTGNTYVGLPTPIKANYEFLGWYTEIDGGIKIKENDYIISYGEHTLYAHWKLNAGTLASNWQTLSGITQSTIKSITFYDTSKVTAPDLTGLTGIDVSQEQSGSILLYQKANTTSLEMNNIYIVSKDVIKFPTNSSYLFSNATYENNLKNVEVMNFNNSIDTSNVTNMSNMFLGCAKLHELDLSNFDTEKVTNMSYMFKGCIIIENINVSSFNTNKVNNMEYMFALGLRLDASNMTTVSSNNKLMQLNVSNFDTSNVTNMSHMFGGCGKLSKLDLSSFDTSKVANMSWMFYGCPFVSIGIGNEQNLNLGENFNTSNVTNMSYMFVNCKNLVELDLSSFDTSNVTAMYNMLDGCTSLRSAGIGEEYDLNFGVHFDTSNVTNMSNMFNNCYALEKIDLSSFDTSNVTAMYNMFNGCTSLRSAGIGEEYDLNFGVHFDTSNVTNMHDMFSVCSRLKKLDLSSFDTSNVTNMSRMFERCAFTSAGVGSEYDLNFGEHFNFSNVTNMSWMFDECASLTNANFSAFNTTNVTNTSGMFAKCGNLKELDLSGFNTSKLTNMSSMFCLCTKLEEIDLSSFDTSSATNMSGMFYECKRLEELNLSSWNTSNVTNMSGMFCNCISLVVLDLSNFDTNKVTKFSSNNISTSTSTSENSRNYGMFDNCTNLVTIYVGNGWSTNSVTDSTNMFKDCTKLVGGAGTTYSSSETNMTYAHVDGGTSNPGYLTYKSNER